MGRLIDADAFAVALKQISEKQGYSELYMNVDDVLNAVIDDLQGKALYGYDNCPTIEAIPKADYEARLKADLEAILVDLQLKIEKMSGLCTEVHGDEWKEINVVHTQDVLAIIQEKINALRGS